MKITGVLKALLLLCILFLSHSCDSTRVFEENKAIPDYHWIGSDKVIFPVEINDTMALYNLLVNVRHTYHYGFSNIWLNIYTVFPDGERYEKRVEIELSNDKGRWHGDCSGDICDFSGFIQQNAFFEKPGTYTFEIEHSMRRDPLPHLMAIGFRVEKTGVQRTITPGAPQPEEAPAEGGE